MGWLFFRPGLDGFDVHGDVHSREELLHFFHHDLLDHGFDSLRLLVRCLDKNFVVLGYAIADPAWLIERLNHLKGLQSNETLDAWRALIAAGDFAALVEELLTRHYDPLYQRSQSHNYASYTAATGYTAPTLDTPALDALAARILAGF